MTFDEQQLRRVAPFALPIVIIALGWLALIRPAVSDSRRTAGELEGLRQRLSVARAAMNEPPPPVIVADPVKAFESHVPARDAGGRIVQELLARAAEAGVSQPAIETGEPGDVSAASGPRVSNAADADPRLQMFDLRLTYTPVTMTFAADYASLGEFLWRLRDLATIVEIRGLTLSRPGEGNAEAPPPVRGAVNATLTLFAYARVADVAQASQPSARSRR
jgi:hypothetical protein